MTMKEGQNHFIIGPIRQMRIAKGSDASVAEITAF
jgi:signal recognition particle GTPase